MVQLDKLAERAFRELIDWSHSFTIAEGEEVATQRDARFTLEFIRTATPEQLTGPLGSYSHGCNQLFHPRVWGGDLRAWDMIESMMAFRSLRYRWVPVKQTGIPEDLGMWILDAIVRGRRDRVRVGVTRFIERLGARQNKPWLAPSLAHFAAWLGVRFLGEPLLDATTLQLGPHVNIAQAWGDGDAFESACVSALAFHLNNAGARPNDGMTFFGIWTFVPIEFEAIRVVRELEGLAMPALDHPFFATPFAQYAQQLGQFDPRADVRYCAVVERLVSEQWVPEGVDYFEV